MRPPSIVTFERFFFVSLLLSVIGFVVGYDAMLAQVAREPAMRQFGLGAEVVIGAFVLGMAVYLLLWFLIARRASNVAKWFLTVFTAIGFLGFVYTAATARPLNPGMTLAYYVFALAAVRYLFMPDARAWLASEASAESAAAAD
jgi:hypothetical protein